MKNLGVIPTSFLYLCVLPAKKMKGIRTERLKNMFALRSFLDASIRATPVIIHPDLLNHERVAVSARTDIKGTVWGCQLFKGL